jgi:hypothetical protein
MTGLRAMLLPVNATLVAAGRRIAHARIFGDVQQGAVENSTGLAEIAVNMGRADTALGIEVGSPVAVSS